MKVDYTVSYSGTLDIPDSDWDEAKDDYADDIDSFALVSVSEEIREFNENIITINSIQR